MDALPLRHPFLGRWYRRAAYGGSGCPCEVGSPLLRLEHPRSLDSDQRRDTAIVYSTRRKCDAMDGRSWYLVVRLASGGVLRRPLGLDRPMFSSEFDVGCASICAVEAAPDFNRDGRHEIEVSLQQGATQEQRGIYGVVRGKLRRFSARPSGNRLSFSYGGGLRYGAFVVCRTSPHAHIVVAVSWGLVDDTHSSVGETIYAFNGLRFRLTGRKMYRVVGGRVPPRVAGHLC